MGERKQVGLTRVFLQSLMEEQLEIQQHVTIDMFEQPLVHNDDTLRHLAKRIVENAITVSHNDLAGDVLSEAGVDNQLTADHKVKSGRLRHVGKRVRKLSRTERKLKVRKAVIEAKSRPALGHENLPRSKARKITL